MEQFKITFKSKNIEVISIKKSARNICSANIIAGGLVATDYKDMLIDSITVELIEKLKISDIVYSNS